VSVLGQVVAATMAGLASKACGEYGPFESTKGRPARAQEVLAEGGESWHVRRRY
jgi:hypothetical protein